MNVCKVQIPSSLYSQLGLKTLTFLNEQQAIDAVKTALVKSNIAFTMQERENKKIFLNNSGGELAAVVPA